MKQKNQMKRLARRIWVMVACAVMVMAVFVLQLINFQLVNGEYYLQQAENTQVYNFEVSAARGDIVDRYGRSIATNRTGYKVELSKGMMTGDLNETLKELVEILQRNGESWNDDAPLTKKGGRPKLPLFSVRPNRQKSRTSEVMAYIRKFAVKNQENVDEILWSLLMLRVQGSNNQVIAQELKRLYGEWLKFISPDSETLNPPMGPLQGVSVIPAAPGAQQMELDVSQMPQQTIHTAEDYHMQGLQLTDNGLIENENEIVTHV